MGDDRDVEPIGVELPGGRHVLRRAGAPGRHDVDVVEFVGTTGGSAHADLNHVTHERSASFLFLRETDVLQRKCEKRTAQRRSRVSFARWRVSACSSWEL